MIPNLCLYLKNTSASLCVSLLRSKCATDNFPVCPGPWFVSTDLTKGFYLVPCNSYIAVRNFGVIFCFCEFWLFPLPLLLSSSSSLARVCCHWGAGLQSKQACFFPTGLLLTGQGALATLWHFAVVSTNIYDQLEFLCKDWILSPVQS